MNIEKYNYLTPDLAQEPRYSLKPISRKIMLYFLDDTHIALIGEADNYYIYWLSVTKREDAQTNRMIFAHISANDPKIFGSRSNAIEKTKYSYEQLTNAYSAELKCAEDIQIIYEKAIRLCRAREANRQYFRIMQYYYGLLTPVIGDAMQMYKQNKELIELIKSESYLRISENKQVREMYQKLWKAARDLYNQYMTEAH